MPRFPRLFVPGATYHVYCRVARGEFVFDDDFEAMEFVERLREVRDLDGWSVFAWCLMGNHYLSPSSSQWGSAPVPLAAQGACPVLAVPSGWVAKVAPWMGG